MAPTLTDQQRSLDQAFDQYVSQWNGMGLAQKISPTGGELRDLILKLATQRNGAQAAEQLAKVLNPNVAPTVGQTLRDRLDGAYPRTDGAGAPPPPPLPVPAAVQQAGLDSPIYNAEPGDGRRWLPGNATLPEMSDADSAALAERDNQIQKLNTELFDVDPALAWRPEGAQLPATGSNISTLGQTYAKAQDLVKKYNEAVGQLKTAVEAAAAEPLIADQRDRLKPALDSLAASAGAAQQLPGAIARGGIAANDAFHNLRSENLGIRKAMATGVEGVYAQAEQAAAAGAVGGLNLRDLKINGMFASLPAITAPTHLDGVAAAVGDIKELTQRTSSPAAVTKQDVTGAPRGEENNAAAGGAGAGGGGAGGVGLPPMGPVPAGPAGAGAPGAATEGGKARGGLNGDDLSRLLSQLTNATAPLAQQAAQIPQQLAQIPQQAAQQAAALPQQIANGVQRAAQTPADLLRQLRDGDSDKAQLAADKKPAADAANRDRDAATTVAYTPPKPAEAAALGAPGSPARPHQLDAAGKPVDRNGDGKVDENAVPLSKRTVKPFDLTVPADGQNVQVKGVPDSRIGEMMLDMADSTGSKPLSVIDAAKAAGMDIAALGDPKDPAQAKMGDAIVGDTQSGLYLGDGKVLTSTGLVENLDDVAGKSGFAAAVPLPGLPDAPTSEAKPDAVTVGNSNTAPAASPAAPAPAPAPAAPPVVQTSADVTPPPAAPAPAAPPPAAAAPPAPPAAPLPPLPAEPAGQTPPPAPAKTGPATVPYEGKALG